MKKGQQSGKTGRADRTQYPMWSVTRCERTEVPPLRDGDNTTQPYRSRTVTTTECVRIVQIPIDIGETNFSVEPIPDKTERKISSKTIMHGVPVVSGLTAEGGLLCNGIQTTPEMTETTTLITTTTTAYNVLEIDNEAPDIKTPDSAIILNTPCDQEYQERQKQNKRYVIIDKKPSPTSTGQIPGHVVKLIDIVMPGETGGEKQEHLEKITKIYDENNACEGTIASTSKTYEIQNEPIERYVRTYHNRYFREEKEKAETLERRKIEQQTVYSNHNTNEVRLYDDQMLPERIRLPLQQYFENNVSHGSLTRTSHYTINKIQQKKESKRKNTNKKGINEADILTAAIQGPKIMGNMKFGDAHMDYPVSSAYEGPLDETDRIRDIEGEPLEQHVTVYHSGRSDDIAPTIKTQPQPTVDVGEMVTDAAQAFGAKITGLFKKGPAYLDYPKSEPYEGRIMLTDRIAEVEQEPLEQHVSVYHIGRYDEPITGKIDQTVEQFVEKPKLGAKLTSLFKFGDAHMDYPVSSAYEGPLDETDRIRDIEGEPLEQHVTMYHSGRSDDIAPTIKTQPQPTGDVESEFFAVKTRALDKPLNYAIDSASPSCLRSFEKFSSQYQNSINDFSVCSCTKQLRDDVQSKGIDLNVSVTANEPFSSEAIPFSRSVPNTSPSFFCHNFLDSNVTAAASENVGFLSGDALLIDCSRVALSEPNVCSKSGIPISSVRHNVQRNVSPTSNLHWTTVSQSTSVFYSKRISIEKTHRSFREDVLRNGSSTRIGAKYYRKHFSDQSKPGYNSYGRSFAVMNTYDFELSKNDTYRPSFENVSVSRLSQWTTFDSMAERDLKSEESIHIGSGKYQEMNRARSLYAQENGRMLDRHAVDCSIPHEISTHGKSLRYNLLKPDAPLGYEFSSATMWESQCSPRRFRIPERRFRPSNTDSYVKEDKMDINSSDNSSYESLYYQPSNLEEIPIVSLVADLPMIEEDAIECVRPTVQPIRTQDLSPGEHMCSRSTKISPLRRARQRIRSYCTML